MSYRQPVRRHRANWHEFVLWLSLFLALYLLSPFSPLPSAIGSLPWGILLSQPSTLAARLGALVPILLSYLVIVYLSERDILLGKPEHPVALLFLTTLAISLPGLSLLKSSSLLLMTLILFTSFGGEGREEQPIPYLITGLLIGTLALVHPIYLLITPLVITTQYILRLATLRNILATLLGLFLPAWLLLPFLLLLCDQGELNNYLGYLYERFLDFTPTQFPAISGISLTYVLLLSILLALGCLLYRRSFGREKIRQRGMIGALQLNAFLLIGFSFIFGAHASELLTLSVIPLSLLLARGMADVPPKLAYALRAVIFLTLLGMMFAHTYYATLPHFAPILQ